MIPRPKFLFMLPWSIEHAGGVNQVVINLARALQIQGSYEPLVLIAEWDARIPVWGNYQGIKTLHWRIRTPVISGSLFDQVKYLAWRLRFQRQFVQFCRAQNVQVFNPHYPDLWAASIERCVRGKLPLQKWILSFHGQDIHQLGSNPNLMFGKKINAFFNRVDCFVTCSHALRESFIANFNRASKVTVVHNGLDGIRFRENARPLSVVPMPRRKYILNVGRFQHQKGQDLLIESFSAIAQTFPEIDLVLVGATDEMLPKLQAQAADAGLTDRILFIADLDNSEVASLFAGATLFVLPSRNESFGIVLLEAAAFKLPTIATAVGGIPEVISNAKFGILIPPDDTDALTNALLAVLNSDDCGKAMGERFNRHAAANFSWTKAILDYLALLDRSKKNAVNVPTISGDINTDSTDDEALNIT